MSLRFRLLIFVAWKLIYRLDNAIHYPLYSAFNKLLRLARQEWKRERQKRLEQTRTSADDAAA